MDREQVEFTTTNGHKISVKTYLTAREARAIEAVYLRGGEVDEFGKPHFKAAASMIQEAEDETIKQMVISVNGQTENILDTILNFKKKDFDEIKAKLDEILRAGADDKKKQ